jgi:hypothetical protein
VAPGALAALAATSGAALATSAYLRRRDPLRVFAILAGRSLDDPAHASEHRARLRAWVADLGADNRSVAHPDKAA